MIFVWPRLFFIPDYNIILSLNALRFDLESHNLRTAVFGLKSNFVENLRSSFLYLGCLIDIDGPDHIGVFSGKPSGVDTMEASIIYLYCC